MEEMIGKQVYSASFPFLNGKIIKEICYKSLPDDDESTLWTVKLQGMRGRFEIYEDEMY